MAITQEEEGFPYVQLSNRCRKMARLFRLGCEILSKNVFASVTQRNITVTAVNRLKEIREFQQGKELVIEGNYIESPREKLLVKPLVTTTPDGKPMCYMCALDLNIMHTDVLILSQFLRSDGCMQPRRITGLCGKQQKRIGTLVTMAQKAGLMININPPNCKKDPTKRKDWKKFNTYYDEKTIFMRKKNSISKKHER